MRPHPRIRKAVKWGGAVVCALLVVIWIGSGWYFLRSGLVGRFGGEVNAGAFWVYESELEDLPFLGWRGPSRRVDATGTAFAYHLAWKFESEQHVRTVSRAVGPHRQFLILATTRIPLWAPFLLAAFVTTIVWRLDTLARRRAKLGACPKCSYSRTGLAPNAVCPECGTAAQPA